MRTLAPVIFCVLGLLLFGAACSPGGGGRSRGNLDGDPGNSSDNDPPENQNEADDSDNDNREGSGGTDSDGERGCGDAAPNVGGANALPRYDLLPSPSVPRAIKVAERPALVPLVGLFP